MYERNNLQNCATFLDKMAAKRQPFCLGKLDFISTHTTF